MDGFAKIFNLFKSKQTLIAFQVWRDGVRYFRALMSSAFTIFELNSYQFVTKHSNHKHDALKKW